MAEPSDSDVTLSDDELELLQGAGRGRGFVVGKAVGAVPFVFGVTGVTGLVRVKPQSELIKADQKFVQVRFIYLTLHVVITVLTFYESNLNVVDQMLIQPQAELVRVDQSVVEVSFINCWPCFLL